MVEIDRHFRRKLLAQLALRFPTVARPAALADKRCRDEDNSAELALWRILGDGMDQKGSAERVTDQDRAIVQGGKLFRKRRFPCGVARIVFMWHPRIADLVTGPELGPQAVD